MAWTTARTIYAVPKQDLTVIIGAGGAPDAALQSGEGIAIRTDGEAGSMVYVTVDSGTTWVPMAGTPPEEVADPGDAAAIPVTQDADIGMTTGGAGETGTIADPARVGLTINLSLAADGGGDRVITAASALNKAGNTVMTFADVGDMATLYSVRDGASSYAWRLVMNDGVVLS